MAKITASQVLTRVDGTVPNSFTAAEKMRWLSQAEGMVRREIYGQQGELPPLTETSGLTVEVPYESLYERYVEAQIFYANGELDRYNNAAAAWNGAYLAVKDYVNRNGAPEKGVSALKVC